MPASQRYILQLLDGDDPVGFHALTSIEITNHTTIFHVQIGELPTMPATTRRERRRTGDGPRVLERFFDPDRDHPILRRLIQTIAPIAIAFLTQKLPTWLSGLDLEGILDPEHDEET